MLTRISCQFDEKRQYNSIRFFVFRRICSISSPECRRPSSQMLPRFRKATGRITNVRWRSVHSPPGCMLSTCPSSLPGIPAAAASPVPAGSSTSPETNRHSHIRRRRGSSCVGCGLKTVPPQGMRPSAFSPCAVLAATLPSRDGKRGNFRTGSDYEAGSEESPLVSPSRSSPRNLFRSVILVIPSRLQA